MVMMSDEYVRVGLNTQERDDNPFSSQDPFNKSWDQLKDFSGLDQNFRRKTARNVTKAMTFATNEYLDSANATPSGVDAGSKAINPGTV
jgi:hypothetical protein